VKTYATNRPFSGSMGMSPIHNLDGIATKRPFSGGMGVFPIFNL
jgi:hypothetical protein